MQSKYFKFNKKIFILTIVLVSTILPIYAENDFTNKEISGFVKEMKMDNLSTQYLDEVEKLFYKQRDLQEYNTALKTVNYLINASIKYNGENHPQTGFAYVARARYYTEIIMPELAKNDLDKAYEIYKKNNKNLDLKSNILYSYADYYSNIEEYFEALKYLSEAIGTEKQSLCAYKAYAELYLNLRNNKVAKAFLDKYHDEILRNETNQDIELFEYHLLMSKLYQNEQNIFLFNEELDKAENILKTYNNSRPDLEILLNIEKVQYFLDTKEFDKALNLLKKNKKLIYKYGKKYQKTNIIQQFIDCYKDKKNLFKFNLYARKINNFYNSLPSDSLLFLTLAEKQIDLYKELGKYNEANTYVQEALNKIEPVKEYTPKLYGKFLRKAAEIKIIEGKTKEAKIYLDKALESYQKTIPEDSFEFYELYNTYGNLENLVQNEKEANNYYKKARAIIKKIKE